MSRRKKKRYKMREEDKRSVRIAIGVLFLVVVVCLVIGFLGSYKNIEGLQWVFNGFGNNDGVGWWEEIQVDVGNWFSGLGKQEVNAKESVSETESLTNYIYEHISGDDKSVVVFGDLEADEETLKQLNKALNNYSGEISVKAVYLDGSQGLSYNSDGEYFSASMVKAPFVLYGFMQMERGNGSPDEVMKYTSEFYHEGTGSMRYSPVGAEFTLKEIMRRTLWESDNVGYAMCVKRWGKEGFNELMTEMGCESFVLENWTTWAHKIKADELLIIWKEIYDFMNNGTEYAQLLYDSCTFYKDCGEYNFMGNALPGYVVSQKYGWSEDAYGDGAIIYGKNRDYLLVVLTDSPGEDYDQQVFTNVVRLINKIMDK